MNYTNIPFHMSSDIMNVSDATYSKTTSVWSTTTNPLYNGTMTHFDMNVSNNDHLSTHATVTISDDYLNNLSRVISMVLLPAVILTGLVGNALAFAIMRRAVFSKRPVPFYLASLAVSDTLLLLCMTISWSYAYLLLQPMPTYMCKVTSFIGPVAIHTSSWILVGMTTHRFIYMYFPHKRKSWYTRRHARTLCVTVTFIFCIVDLAYVFSSASTGRYKHTFHLCGTEPWAQKYLHAGMIIHEIFYALLPSTILIILSIFIVYWLFRQPKLNSLQYSVMARNARRVTIVLLLIVLVFVISSVSLCSIDNKNFTSGDGTEKSSVTIAVVEVVWLFNFSCNFYVSVGTSKEYRAELKRMLTGDTKVVPILDASPAT